MASNSSVPAAPTPGYSHGPASPAAAAAAAAQRGAASVAAPSTGGRQLRGAAGKSYSVASAWERTAQLNDQQLRVVDALAAVVGQRPFPAHLSEEPAAAADAAGPATAAAAAAGAPAAGGAAAAKGGDAAASYVGSLEDAVLHNANQFHKWHTELEAACASETEEKYRRYASLLQGHLASCDTLQDQVSSTLGVFDSLLSLHSQVASASAALSGSSEALLSQKATLCEFADALRARLRFFDEYELAASQFAAAAAAPDSSDLIMPLLRKLDECIGYVAANPQYADAVAYAAKFRTLQGKALSLVRSRVQAVLRGAAQAVQAAVAEAVAGGAGGAGAAAAAGGGRGPARTASGVLTVSARGVPVLPEGLEVSLLYVRFRAAAEPALKGLLAEVESKRAQPEYAQLLDDCRQAYCSTRQQVLSPYLSARLDSLSGLELPQLVRAASEQVLRASQLEGQLLEQLFGTAATAAWPLKHQQQQLGYGGSQGAAAAPLSSPLAEALRPLLEPVGQLLYDLLRPRFVQLADMDSLAELIDILQHEVLRDQLSRRAGPGGEALVPAISRACADLQERLIYRSHAFIRDAVTSFQPRPDDLAYPGKLEAAAAAAESAAAAATAAAAAGSSADGGGSNGGSEITADVDAAEEETQPLAAPAADQWYPPVRGTLLLLSKLYRCVDTRIFAGLAQEAVAACTVTVQAGGRAIAKASSPLDAQLFVIQQLLFLREQIAHFDVDLTVTDIDLDFSHMRDHVRRIMTGQASLFTLSSSNAVVQMLGRSGPRVVSASIDSKRDLEQQLKGHCEAYIMGLTKAAVEPMLGFITKVTAVRLAAGSNKDLAKPLREQAFAAPAKLAELVAGVNSAMHERLPPTVAKTRLYLPNPATRAILFRPIKSNIAEAHGQVAQLLEAEYSPEEAAAVPLLQPDQLKLALDELS